MSLELWTSGANHYPEKDDGFFYFELRNPDEGNDILIEDSVLCNNIGSVKATSDILADAIALGISKSVPEGERKEPVFWSELGKIYQTVITH